MQPFLLVEYDQLAVFLVFLQHFLALVDVAVVVGQTQQRRHQRVVRLQVALQQRRVDDLTQLTSTLDRRVSLDDGVSIEDVFVGAAGGAGGGVAAQLVALLQQ